MINLNQVCPRCQGFTFEPDSDDKDCKICFGSGDLGDAVMRHIENSHKAGGLHGDPIMQLVAKHLIDNAD